MTNAPDEWATRYPAEYIEGDLTPAALESWRDCARQDEAGGRSMPFTTTPRASYAVHREVNSDPLRQWQKGRMS